MGLMGPLWDEAISARFLFLIERPKSHRRADGSIKAGAPLFPVAKPDVLKLARAAEDALSGSSIGMMPESLMSGSARCTWGPAAAIGRGCWCASGRISPKIG